MGADRTQPPPDVQHAPVLLPAVLELLRPRAGGRYLDATVGLGGHAAAMLEASGPGGTLEGRDRDEAALDRARGRLAPYGGRARLRRANFRDLGREPAAPVKKKRRPAPATTASWPTWGSPASRWPRRSGGSPSGGTAPWTCG